jgi:hypothetical protein
VAGIGTFLTNILSDFIWNAAGCAGFIYRKCVHTGAYNLFDELGETMHTHATEQHSEEGYTMTESRDRVKVHIRCRKCGESFILRGQKDIRGHIDTGFKRCLCDNESDFEIETLN